MYLATFIIGAIVGFWLAALMATAAEKPHEAAIDNGIPPWMPTWEHFPKPPPPAQPTYQVYTFDELIPPDGVSKDVGLFTIVQEESGVLMVQIPTDVVWIRTGDRILHLSQDPTLAHTLIVIRGKNNT